MQANKERKTKMKKTLEEKVKEIDDAGETLNALKNDLFRYITYDGDGEDGKKYGTWFLSDEHAKSEPYVLDSIEKLSDALWKLREEYMQIIDEDYNIKKDYKVFCENDCDDCPIYKIVGDSCTFEDFKRIVKR